MISFWYRGPSPPPSATVTLTPRQAAAPSNHPVPSRGSLVGLGRSVPVALEIPAIGVHTPLSELGLNSDGTVELPPPDRTAPAGWYRYGASPGETGTAVILGHVDSRRYGPAVFFRLAELRPGNTIAVLRADGVTARFTVTATARYPKTSFPTQEVYGQVSFPALRLVTCGGTFDRQRRSYRDVVVVYAELSAVAAGQQGRWSSRSV
jgi:sortase (surface protein transpeptidase)